MAAGPRTAAAVALIACCGAAPPLPRLHVRSVTLIAQTTHPRIESPFSLQIAVRVAERNAPIRASLFLPDLGGLEELGEVVAESSPPSGGTIYRETLRVVAHAGGPMTIAPVVFEAIDARDGRPKRFLSDPLRIDPVGGAALAADPLRILVRLAIGTTAVLIAGMAFARSRRTLRDPIAAAYERLVRERTRAAAIALREDLRSDCGIAPSTTLQAAKSSGAVSRRNGERLAALERACFVPAPLLQSAIDAVIARWEGLE